MKIRRRRSQSHKPLKRLRRSPVPKPITPAEARHRAAQHVARRMFKGAKVADGTDVRLSIYARGTWKANQVWVVYKDSAASMELKSSDVVIVSKRTGRVLYEGSAGDEG